MLSRISCLGLVGTQAYRVDVEVDIAHGLPTANIVGLADTSIRESRERVKSAIKNSGYRWPAERITINLAPSDTKKEGSCFDLAIALGILSATNQINNTHLEEFCFIAELSLDGSLRSVDGILPLVVFAAQERMKNIIVPQQNAKEAGMVSGINVFPSQTLKQTIEILNSPEGNTPFAVSFEELFKKNNSYLVDFCDVKGQYLAKRAVEVAVAGRHNILMIGPPGSGKSMIAKRIPTIMPAMSVDESLEATTIHSLAGALPKHGIQAIRPFRNPHHTISDIALIGGGSLPKPGEISLAHAGVLFMDELPEFKRNSLEALRQPLEDGMINVSRINKSISFPASFMLVAAMNPCPCGYYTDHRKACRCNPNTILHYLGKISGPLLDRIDIHIELNSIKYTELVAIEEPEPSEKIMARVNRARSIQKARFQNEKIQTNSQMETKLIKRYCFLEPQAQELLQMAMTELGFSARAYDKILKISRTIADLAADEKINDEHISEAIQYRALDKQFL